MTKRQVEEVKQIIREYAIVVAVGIKLFDLTLEESKMRYASELRRVRLGLTEEQYQTIEKGILSLSWR